MDETFRTSVQHLTCPKGFQSGGQFVALPESFDSYFREEQKTCVCGRDWFDVVQEFMQQLPERWTISELLGGLFVIRDLALAAGQDVMVSFDDMGIPLGAEVFEVNFTLIGGGSGGLPFLPALVFGNNLHLDPFPRSMIIHGVPRGGDGELRVQLSIRYVAPGPEEIPLQQLCAAGKHFVAGRFDGIILSANVAVEAALGKALTLWLERFRPKAEVESFLSDGATYSHQLKVLCQLAAHDVGVPAMPGAVRNKLDELRKYRNEVAHHGTPYRADRPPLKKDTAASLLAAALFGYQYARFLREAVERTST